MPLAPKAGAAGHACRSNGWLAMVRHTRCWRHNYGRRGGPPAATAAVLVMPMVVTMTMRVMPRLAVVVSSLAVLLWRWQAHWWRGMCDAGRFWARGGMLQVLGVLDICMRVLATHEGA